MTTQAEVGEDRGIAHEEAVPADVAAAVSTLPPLTLLAGIASLIDLVLRRGFLRTATSFVSHRTLLLLEPWARFTVTLAALACLVALVGALHPLLTRSTYLSMPRRAGTAIFLSLFLPCALTATFLPAARTTTALVLVGTVAGHVLALQLGLVALEWRAMVGIRVTCTTTALAALGAFGSLVLSLVGPLLGWEPSYRIATAFRDTGELAYLVTPIVLSASLLSHARGPWLRARISIAVVLLLAGTVGFVYVRSVLGPDYETVLYGALRLSAFAHAPPPPYALTVGMCASTAFFGLTSTSSIDRQLGAAVLLFHAAGYGPRSPAQLVMMLVAVTLFARAVIASALSNDSKASA